MIIDSRTEFCDATDLDTSGTGMVALGNVIDLEQGGLDFGHGAGLYLVLQVNTAPTSDGDATVQFTLASDDSADLAVDGTATEHLVTPEYDVADMAAGDVLAILEVPTGTYEQYLGLLQTTGTAALTAGALDAFLTINPPSWRAYPDAA